MCTRNNRENDEQTDFIARGNLLFNTLLFKNWNKINYPFMLCILTILVNQQNRYLSYIMHISYIITYIT